MEEPFTIVASAIVVRGASPTSLLMNRLRPCCDLAQPYTPFILVSKSAQFFPCSDSIYETYYRPICCVSAGNYLGYWY
ncbi:hypothetical protein HN873_057986 [Arachis hypogaea]